MEIDNQSGTNLSESVESGEAASYKEIIQSIEVRFTTELPDIETMRTMVGEVWPLAPNPDPMYFETPEEQLNRQIVNYVRHYCTNYDEILYNYNINTVGYPILSEKVHDLIADRFPELSESCNQRIEYIKRKTSLYSNFDAPRTDLHDEPKESD